MKLTMYTKLRGHFLNFCKYHKQKLLRTPKYLLTQRVRLFLDQCGDSNMPSDEIKKTRNFLRYNLIDVFNDPFVYQYNFGTPKVILDKEKGLWFVYTFDKKRLYFKRGMSRKRVIWTYNCLLREQDSRSPHCYFFDGLDLSKDSIVADIGVAEGNFSLEIVDRVNELYLFECDPDWIEALQATFEPWKEKVHIVNLFVSDEDSQDTVRLDNFFEDKVPDLLKLDVEGAEEKVLNGALNLLKSSKINELLVCTYHKQGDAENLSGKLKDLDYSISFSQGYMLFLSEGYQDQPPYNFRKGLLHARLKNPLFCRK